MIFSSTGILTNNHQDSSYVLTPGQDKSSEEPYLSERDISGAASTVSPNPIIEKYLEKRLEEEASMQKDVEQKQEAQQLIQILRKAYLKQLVESLKEEENVVTTSTTTTSTESTRGSRSIESQEKYMKNNVMSLLLEKMRTMDMDMSPSEVEDVIKTPLEEHPTIPSIVLSSSVGPFVPLKLDTDIFSTSTETSTTTTTTTRPQLSISNRVSSESTERAPPTRVPEETTTATSTTTTTEKSLPPVEEEGATGAASVLDLPAMWVKAENSFSGEGDPFVIRVRRQAPTEEEYEEQNAGGQERSSDHQSDQGEDSSSATPSPEVQNQVKSFVEDIKKFFTLLNVLDQDQCLQKLVCDVHTNQKDPATITQYEQNILTTFR